MAEPISLHFNAFDGNLKPADVIDRTLSNRIRVLGALLAGCIGMMNQRLSGPIRSNVFPSV